MLPRLHALLWSGLRAVRPLDLELCPQHAFQTQATETHSESLLPMASEPASSLTLPSGHGFLLHQGQPQEEATHRTRARVQAATGKAKFWLRPPGLCVHPSQPQALDHCSTSLASYKHAHVASSATGGPAKLASRCQEVGVPSQPLEKSSEGHCPGGWLPPRWGSYSHLPFWVQLVCVTFTQ